MSMVIHKCDVIYKCDRRCTNVGMLLYKYLQIHRVIHKGWW